MTCRTPRPSLALSAALAAALALGPQAYAQSGGQTAEDGGAYTAQSDVPGGAQEDLTALQQAVLDELEAIGITNLTVDKLSNGQLAGILLTLTATDRQDKEEAVTTIMADNSYDPGEIDADSVAGNESLRDAVENALSRAGWSADVSQLNDGQVAALYAELADRGSLDEGRIEDVLSN